MNIELLGYCDYLLLALQLVHQSLLQHAAFRPDVSMWPTALPRVGVLLLVVHVLVLLHTWTLLAGQIQPTGGAYLLKSHLVCVPWLACYLHVLQ